MPKRKKEKKMTVKEEIVESAEMEVDQDEEDDTTSEPESLLKTLESASGLKLVKKVIQNSKEICKLLVGKGDGGFHLSILSTAELIQFSRNLSERVQKVCDKYSKAPDKVAKFFSKICSDDDNGRLSCESEMFRQFLKYGMNSPQNSCPGGPSLIAILQAIYSVAVCYHSKVDNPTLGIQMIVSHSSAPDIFLESHQFLPKNHHLKGKTTNLKKQDGERENFPDEKPMIMAAVVEEEKYSEIKTQLLKLWRTLVIAFSKISKSKGTSNDKKILENSVPYLFQMYSATMSLADQEIYQILREYTGKRLQIPIEQLPLFGPKSLEPAVVKATSSKASNPLFLHSNRANAILGLLNERQAYQTAMEYREGEDNGQLDCNKNHYDLRFTLPLVCHVLDSKNICDAVRVIGHGWIYLILRGLSLEDDVMRNMAFLGLKLLIQNFQLPKKGFKMQDIKVWLHFLLSIRQGLQNRGSCKVSNLLATWMVASFECLRQPNHPLYPRLTNLLFAKPVIDLSVLPDFLPFFNAVDGNKQTREWIMGILKDGLQTREDWQVGQRLPMINSLCSVFLVEKLGVQREIVGILCKGARIPEVAVDMVERYGVLIWIGNVRMEQKNRWYGKELNELFRTLRASCCGMGGGGDLGGERELRWEMLFEFVERKQGWMEVEEDAVLNDSS